MSRTYYDTHATQGEFNGWRSMPFNPSARKPIKRKWAHKIKYKPRKAWQSTLHIIQAGPWAGGYCIAARPSLYGKTKYPTRHPKGLYVELRVETCAAHFEC